MRNITPWKYFCSPNPGRTPRSVLYVHGTDVTITALIDIYSFFFLGKRKLALDFLRECVLLLKLVDAILAGEVEYVVLAHQDRLARFGYQLLVHLCRTHQCKPVVMNM